MERLRRGLIALLALPVAACATPEPVVRTVEVKVPVAVPAEIPRDLLFRLPPIPRAVMPSAPDAAVCFTPDGAEALASFVIESRARHEALKAMAGKSNPPVLGGTKP